VTRNLDRDTPLKRIGKNQAAIRNEERKPVLGGPQIYVGTFVAPNDPGNDPADASTFSPPWQNGFTYVPGSPLWFAHGVDGETDMGGAYDLITGSPVSGTVAFDMPLEWAAEAQAYTAFVVLLDNTPADEADWLYGIAAQIVNQATGEVRVYWPICAEICVT
jgi:hypothetical protein